MKTLLATFSLLVVAVNSTQAGTEIFGYDDFGPQVAVHELIGFGWFQWDSHGDDDPKSDPRIKVVVYWDEDLSDVKEQYPVDESKLQDYRYLEVETALEHLRTLIPEFESQDLNTDLLKTTLRKLTLIRSSEQAAGLNLLTRLQLKCLS